MTEEQTESLVRKIRMLLRKTVENGATPAEAASAAAKARELMDREGLTVSPEDVKRESCTDDTAFETRNKTGLKMWESRLSLVCELVCDVKTFISNNQRVRFAGLPRDVAIAVELYNGLRAMLWAAAKSAYPRASVERRSYCLGFISAVMCGARQAKEEAVQASSHTTAIVHVKKDMVTQYVEEKFNIRKARRSRIKGNSNAYDHGYAHGSTVRVGKNQLS